MHPSICARRVVGILNRAALEGLAYFQQPDGAFFPINLHLHAPGDIRTLLGTARQAHAAIGALCLSPLFPSKSLCRGFQNSPQPFVLQVRQPVLERVFVGCESQFVHERLPGEIVGCRRQHSVGALPQRRLGLAELLPRILDVIRRRQRGSTGIVVYKLPRQKPPILIKAGTGLDQCGGPKVCPREFLFPRPAKRDGPPRRFCQPRRFHRGFSRMLAAETAARIGHDHADMLLRKVESLGQLLSDTIRLLRAGPNGNTPVLPLGHRRPGLHRSMLDVGNLIGRAQHSFG